MEKYEIMQPNSNQNFFTTMLDVITKLESTKEPGVRCFFEVQNGKPILNEVQQITTVQLPGTLSATTGSFNHEPLLSAGSSGTASQPESPNPNSTIQASPTQIMPSKPLPHPGAAVTDKPLWGTFTTREDQIVRIERASHKYGGSTLKTVAPVRVTKQGDDYVLHGRVKMGEKSWPDIRFSPEQRNAVAEATLHQASLRSTNDLKANEIGDVQARKRTLNTQIKESAARLCSRGKALKNAVSGDPRASSASGSPSPSVSVRDVDAIGR